MKDIITLAMKIRDNNLGMKGEFLKLKEEEASQLIDFIFVNFDLFSDNYVFNLLIEDLSILEKLTVEDWLLIASNLANNPHGLFKLLAFLHKYIRVNFYEMLKNKEVITLNQQKYLEDKFNFKLLDFALTDQIRLEQHSISVDNFKNIKEQFINYGFKPLEIVSLHKEDYRLQVFFNQKKGEYQILK